jgi:hypothetical protein
MRQMVDARVLTGVLLDEPHRHFATTELATELGWPAWRVQDAIAEAGPPAGTLRVRVSGVCTSPTTDALGPNGLHAGTRRREGRDHHRVKRLPIVEAVLALVEVVPA